VNRHRRLGSATAALIADVLAECVRLKLPAPQVSVLEVHSLRAGLSGRLRLLFPKAIEGPVVLGRARLLGGGLFCGVPTLGASRHPFASSEGARRS
jgi:hypothetical protein